MCRIAFPKVFNQMMKWKNLLSTLISQVIVIMQVQHTSIWLHSNHERLREMLQAKPVGRNVLWAV